MTTKVTIYVAQKDIPTLLEELPKDSLERLAGEFPKIQQIEDEQDRAIAAIEHILGFFMGQHRAWFYENNIPLPKTTYDTVIHPVKDIVQGWNIIYEFDRAEDAARFDLRFG